MLVTPGHVKLSVPPPLSLQCCHHLSPAFPGLLVPRSWLSRVLGQLAERETGSQKRPNSSLLHVGNFQPPFHVGTPDR